MDPYYELEQLNIALLAAEDWSEEYARAPKQHAGLIKQSAKMQRQVLVYLRDLAKETPKTINWYAYARAVIEQQQALRADNIEAYDVNVVINQDAADQQDQTFIKIVFDTISTVQALGVESMEVEHGMSIGVSTTSALIQNLTTKQLAQLVGMKVDKASGLVVQNPNPIYNITETTRDKIAQSIKTSISLGENQQAAVKRLMKVIADPARADVIAYTETVRGYAEGRHLYAKQSGATGKYWSDRNATDICADNAAQGTIPIDDDFVSHDANEPAHPRCQCIVVYTYD